MSGDATAVEKRNNLFCQLLPAPSLDVSLPRSTVRWRPHLMSSPVTRCWNSALVRIQLAWPKGCGAVPPHSPGAIAGAARNSSRRGTSSSSQSMAEPRPVDGFTANDQRAERIRAHTDSKALVDLWLRDRNWPKEEACESLQR